MTPLELVVASTLGRPTAPPPPECPWQRPLTDIAECRPLDLHLPKPHPVIIFSFCTRFLSLWFFVFFHNSRVCQFCHFSLALLILKQILMIFFMCIFDKFVDCACQLSILPISTILPICFVDLFAFRFCTNSSILPILSNFRQKI